MKEFTIGKNDAGQRLDRFVSKSVPLLPAALLQKYIRLKRIKCNGARAQRDQRLQEGDVLQLYINDEFFDKPREDNAYLTVATPKLNIVYEDESREVKIPSNMFVLATMNTADQNVFTLDTAFQRRWKMEHIPNRFVFEDGSHAMDLIQGTNLNWGTFATVINEQILEINRDVSSSEDKRLGAYFVKKSELEVSIFPEKVLKYLWDDAFKMDKEAVFDSKFSSLEEVIEVYESSSVDKLKSVLRAEIYTKMLHEMRNRSKLVSEEDVVNQ